MQGNLYSGTAHIRARLRSAKRAEVHLQREGGQGQEIDAENLAKELRESQIIKGLSYYLGYPLANAVLEKYSIEGVKIALEKNLPLEAKYFAAPEEYVALLEELQVVRDKRRVKKRLKKRKKTWKHLGPRSSKKKRKLND